MSLPDHFYYLCRNCNHVAIISHVILTLCPNCRELLAEQRDLNAMLSDYDDSIEFTIWERVIETAE